MCVVLFGIDVYIYTYMYDVIKLPTVKTIHGKYYLNKLKEHIALRGRKEKGRI